MTDDKILGDQLDEFINLIDNLEDLEVKIKDDYKALMLLNVLPKSVENYKDALLFGRQDWIKYDDIQTTTQDEVSATSS